MASYNLDSNTSLVSFHGLLLLFFFFYHITASPQELLAETVKDVCGMVNCGEGKCVASITSLLGFDCTCNPGWKQMQIGPLKLPACTVPNCTVNNECGNGAQPPLPPPPTNAPPLDLLNPCNLVWCGDGTCVVNGLTYNCKCNEGSANFMNLTGVACFKQCYLAADCNGFALGPPSKTPPPPPGNAFGSSPSTPQPPVNECLPKDYNVKAEVANYNHCSPEGSQFFHGSSNEPNCSPTFRRVTVSLSFVSLLLLASST